MVGETWPTDGRQIGIVVDADAPDESVQSLVEEIRDAGMVALVVAARGGVLADGSTPVQRTFASARSVELDALLVAAAPAPAPDALVSRDAKSGQDAASDLDPRLVLLLTETFRHAKVIGAWGAGVRALEAQGISESSAGVVVGDSAASVLGQVADLLGKHRAWDRFAASL